MLWSGFFDDARKRSPRSMALRTRRSSGARTGGRILCVTVSLDSRFAPESRSLERVSFEPASPEPASLAPAPSPRSDSLGAGDGASSCEDTEPHQSTLPSAKSTARRIPLPTGRFQALVHAAAADAAILGDSEQGEPENSEQGEPENSEQGEPENSEQGEPENSEQGEPENSEQGEPENSEQGEPENSEQGEPENSEQGEPENSEQSETQNPEQGEPENSEQSETQNPELSDPETPKGKGSGGSGSEGKGSSSTTSVLAVSRLDGNPPRFPRRLSPHAARQAPLRALRAADPTPCDRRRLSFEFHSSGAAATGRTSTDRYRPPRAVGIVPPISRLAVPFSFFGRSAQSSPAYPPAVSRGASCRRESRPSRGRALSQPLDRRALSQGSAHSSGGGSGSASPCCA